MQRTPGTTKRSGPVERIGLYVCTHRRNDELDRLLRSVARAAVVASDRAEVGVVVVDDNADGRARPVADQHREAFPLGVTYRHVGGGNIARARNAGIDAALDIGDWVAMTDDDIVVPPTWFTSMLDVVARTGADAVTGPLLLTFDARAPRWLREEPFDQIGLMTGADDQLTELCATGNSMVRSEWLAAHPDIRFDPTLGEVGGEDVVFFRRAVAAGLAARYSRSVAVRELEPPSRATLAYQLRRAMWMGNTQYVTNVRLGTSRTRLVLRGARRLVRALGRPVGRARRGQWPQVRYAAAEAAEGIGFFVGAAGVEMEHR